MKPIQRYIEWAKKQGYSDWQITEVLKQRGFHDDQIHAHYEHPLLKQATFGLAIIVAIMLVVSGIYLLAPNTCQDEECFIQRANACQKASFQKDREGTNIQFTTNDCLFTESIYRFHPEETEEIKALFQNKEMVCTYRENDFPVILLQGLTTIDSCAGELKGAIHTVEELLR